MKYFNYVFMLSILLLSATGCLQRADNRPVAGDNEKLLVATLFHQHAAEMRALSYQAYNVAATRLNETLKDYENPENLAIVLDLDETVMDNSPYQAACILRNFNYPTGWTEWVNLAEAPALPGAVEFLHEAIALGVQVFYISNRREVFREATKENFKRVGIPLQSDGHLILRTAESGKETRRQVISNDYKIIMLIGDNLSDFHEVFDNQSSLRRNVVTDSLKHKFGELFIVLPNTMYGDWLQALQNHDYTITDDQKQQLYYDLLKGFDYEITEQ